MLAEDSTFYTARLLTAEDMRAFTVLTVAAKLLTRESVHSREEAPQTTTKLLTKEQVVSTVEVPPVETRILTYERTKAQEFLSYGVRLLSLERTIVPSTTDHNTKTLTYEEVRMGV